MLAGIREPGAVQKHHGRNSRSLLGHCPHNRPTRRTKHLSRTLTEQGDMFTKSRHTSRRFMSAMNIDVANSHEIISHVDSLQLSGIVFYWCSLGTTCRQRADFTHSHKGITYSLRRYEGPRNPGSPSRRVLCFTY